MVGFKSMNLKALLFAKNNGRVRMRIRIL